MGKENEVTWTKEQQKVISQRDCNILVSAAAGSGKTAVLVERIITMITDKEKPIDIDQLLVVTFTNAAAAEMRERIGKAIEKRLESEPENLHLQKQATLIRNAQITTLHSFCQNVIRNYFNEIDLDPNFRIGDETELKLLKNDVLEEVFEGYYEKGEEGFLELVECYSGSKSDQGLVDLVLQLHTFAMSYPWPKEWLREKLVPFSINSGEELEEAQWIKPMFAFVEGTAKALIAKTKSAFAITKEETGPYMYQEALQEDLALLEELEKIKSYAQTNQLLSEYKWKALSRKKDENVDNDKKEKVKEIRAVVKKAVEDLKKQFFFQDTDSMISDMQKLEKPMTALIDLTESFMNAYAQKKSEKCIIDFNDLEHFALQILVEKDGNKVMPTPVAIEYSHHFVEILVDEYQDSNGVQETILNSITREREGCPNLFMVGDVKQSIYKFRMARPELFMEKYNTYSLTEGLYQRIDLAKNFRSRAVVLESVNSIFEKIMEKSLGNIDYDERAALYVGNTDFPKGENVSRDTELLLCTDSKEEQDTEDIEELELSEEEQEMNHRELEARMAAKRIRELVSGELMVQDKGTKELRNCNYGDIVILLRTMSGWSDTFIEVLSGEGIPTYTDTRSGYFSTYEVRTILQFLKVLDNPNQDIPLAAVLRSMIGGFDSRELATIRYTCRYQQREEGEEVRKVPLSLYDSLKAYKNLSEDSIDISLQEKTNRFFDMLEEYRDMVSYCSIHQLLEKIYEKTGYYTYVSVMPNGMQRRDNLELLLQKAIDFEETSLSSLFHFNRYIEKLHKYEVDFGEAVGSEMSENAVRIMSIHKSKGLEFPVVFVSGMGKTFNTQDARSKLVLDMDLGLGPDYVDYKLRTKMPSLLKKIIQKRAILENLGEELRVLYVALTRAKEKLIMTGFHAKGEEQLEKWKEKLENQSKVMDYFSRTQAKNYLDWVAPVILNDETGQYKLNTFSLSDLVYVEVEKQLAAIGKKEDLFSWNTEVTYQGELLGKLEERQSYLYPYEKEKSLKSKMTVSELKRLGYMSEEETGTVEFEEPIEDMEENVPVPEFLQENKEEMQGADRGTLYHKFMECLKIGEVNTLSDVKKQLENLIQNGIFTQEESKVFYQKKILAFCKSALGKRMAVAESAKKIWREAPFVIGIPARQIKDEWDSDEVVLIQGMMDAYFEEGEELVLVDYKTDRVHSEKELIQRYQSQMDYYQKALEQISGKKVKEKVIYSLYLEKEILLV